MVEAAAQGVAGIEASRIEIDRGGSSYTADTLAALRDQHDDPELFLIVGSDAAGGLMTWERVDEVRDGCTVVVVDRPGAEGEQPPAGWRWLRVEVPRLEVSSTDLRARVDRRPSARLPASSRRHRVHPQPGALRGGSPVIEDPEVVEPEVGEPEVVDRDDVDAGVASDRSRRVAGRATRSETPRPACARSRRHRRRRDRTDAPRRTNRADGAASISSHAFIACARVPGAPRRSRSPWCSSPVRSRCSARLPGRRSSTVARAGSSPRRAGPRTSCCRRHRRRSSSASTPKAKPETIAVASLRPGGRGGFFILMPTLLRVEVPGIGPAPLASAFATGGATLLRQTVETALDIRVEQVSVLDTASWPRSSPARSTSRSTIRSRSPVSTGGSRSCSQPARAR